MAPLAARRLSEQVALGEELLGLGLVVAAQAVDVRGCAPLGRGTSVARDQVRERYEFVAAGDSIGPDRGAVVELVRSGALGVAGDAPSLRPWLAQLAAGGRLVEVADELDPADGLAARLIAHRREPVRIARVRGGVLPVVANLMPSRALIAEALGVPSTRSGRTCSARWPRRWSRASRTAARARRSSRSSPILRSCRYPASSRTRGAVHHGRVHRRPRSRDRRAQLVDRARAAAGRLARTGRIAPNHHLAVAARAARERGARLPIAVTIGNHPALMVAACLYLARGEDELRVAGALLGEPVSLVRCTDVPLEVPAGCEIVLEGELDLDASVEEGPVSEFHGGYERYGRAATATFHCLTRRSDAVYQAILPGFHPEHALLGGVAIAAGLERRLRAVAPRSGPSRCPRPAPAGSRRSSPSGRTNRRRRAVALAALEAVNLVKLVTVVDDDIDPWDDAAVAHAVATRVHFDRDLHVLPGMRADRAEPLERNGTIAKLAIDATRQAGDRDDWTPAEPPA